MTFGPDEEYEGYFNEGFMHGLGKYVFPKEGSYEGNWLYGKRHG